MEEMSLSQEQYWELRGSVFTKEQKDFFGDLLRFLFVDEMVAI